VFKRSAEKLLGFLQETSPGQFSLSLNPEKPRKGTFKVEVAGKTYVELVALPRPFQKLRETDLSQLASKIACS